MLRARLLVWWWWLAVARALPVGDQAASDWAWGWWEHPPYLAWTEAEPPLPVGDQAASDWAWARGRARAWARAWAEAEPPLIVLEDVPRVREDSTFMEAVDDWTPRMKREYLREQRNERNRYWDAPPRSATPSPSPIPGDEWAVARLPVWDA